MRSNLSQIISPCLGLQTHNPGLKEVDLEPSPNRGSDKINMLQQGRNTQEKASHTVQPGLTYGPQHLERQTWNPMLRKEYKIMFWLIKQVFTGLLSFSGS